MCNLEMKHVAIPIVGNLEILGVETASRWVISSFGIVKQAASLKEGNFATRGQLKEDNHETRDKP